MAIKLSYHNLNKLKGDITRAKILDVISDKPMIAEHLAKLAKVPSGTIRRHLAGFVRAGLIHEVVNYRTFGDRSKRYFLAGVDVSQFDDMFTNKTKRYVFLQEVAAFCKDVPRKKNEICDKFGITIKRCHLVVKEMLDFKLCNIIKVRYMPWHSERPYYYCVTSDLKKVKEVVKQIEAKYKGMTRTEYEAKQKESAQDESINLPDLPANLLSMMGYTNVKPPEGKKFNVDEYSAAHPDWNKYQSRKGTQYSQYGSSMRYFELEAGV